MVDLQSADGGFTKVDAEWLEVIAVRAWVRRASTDGYSDPSERSIRFARIRRLRDFRGRAKSEHPHALTFTGALQDNFLAVWKRSARQQVR